MSLLNTYSTSLETPPLGRLPLRHARQRTSLRTRILSQAPRGFWPLGEGATPWKDVSTGGRDFTLTSGSVTPGFSTTLVSGENSVNLNGTLAPANAPFTSAATFTLELWARFAANVSMLFYCGNTGSNGFGFLVSSHQFGGAGVGTEFQGLLGGVGYINTAPTILAFNTPYLLAMTRTSTAIVLSVNGVSVGTSALGPGGASNSLGLIGTGEYSYAAMYDYALTLPQLVEHYNLGRLR